MMMVRRMARPSPYAIEHARALRVGHSDTDLTCTVPAGVTTCTSTGSVTIPPASLISIGSTTTGSPTATFVRFGWRATSG
jgi:hypothetical protein